MANPAMAPDTTAAVMALFSAALPDSTMAAPWDFAASAAMTLKWPRSCALATRAMFKAMIAATSTLACFSQAPGSKTRSLRTSSPTMDLASEKSSRSASVG
ncbi:hypothetical protein D3C75_1208150 [compost metagenome]